LFDIADLFDRMAAHVERETNLSEGVEEDLERATIRTLCPRTIEMGGQL
jgi:hypothetical protein